MPPSGVFVATTGDGNGDLTGAEGLELGFPKEAANKVINAIKRYINVNS
jgi:hypothetical protein